MSHVQESTLHIDKNRDDISDVLNELWRRGVLLRLEPEEDAITVHCSGSIQMQEATAIVLAGTPFAVQDDPSLDDPMGSSGTNPPQSS